MVTKVSMLKLVSIGYVSVFLSFFFALSYMYFYYVPYIECIKLGSGGCSTLPTYLIEWYGEWSLIFNSLISAIIVTYSSFELRARKIEI